MSGAIAMIAFGVLEYKPPFPHSPDYDKKCKSNEEILKLAMDAFRERGWLLTYSLPPPRSFSLFGPVLSAGLGNGRHLIDVGSLSDVCRTAVEHEKLFLEDPDEA
jgi:hypothetical protein